MTTEAVLQMRKTGVAQKTNQVKMQFQSIGKNAALARLIVAALVAEHDLTLADLDEIKVAVSEAVSNAIIHGYGNNPHCLVGMSVTVTDDLLTISIEDSGVGIADVHEAMQANFSSDAERMGLGFSFMQSFMDEVQVHSVVCKGTTVTMSKRLPELSRGEG
ncbi:MAG: anti-sigma F factor [Bacillota bacterium]|jgi:stage II sporulation protein AB (anti-sigma F factor)